MGRLTKEPTLFDKAVSIFLKIAEARTRKKSPLIWATTLANIGAAMKEKGVAARNADYLTQAAQAFDLSAQVFTELNLESNVKIVETQRDHVLLILAAQGAR